MGDFAKLVGRFFARDFLYFLGGANIMISFALSQLYVWNANLLSEILSKTPIGLLAVFAGLAYVLGYIVNFLFGLIGLSSAGDRLVPGSGIHRIRGWIARTVFLLLNRYPFDEVTEYIKEEISFKTYKCIKPAHIYALQALHPRQDYLSRAITLHHLGSVLGSSLVVCFLVLGYGHICHPTDYSLVLVIFSLFAGTLLCLDSNYRSAQIAFATAMIHKWRPELEKEIEA